MTGWMGILETNEKKNGEKKEKNEWIKKEKEKLKLLYRHWNSVCFFGDWRYIPKVPTGWEKSGAIEVLRRLNS